ncbi:hypothetical protein HMPREF9120_01001 [Neisseria sp. oral taxon 020 str. F0370]|nr:hypothetical protein HMPREF9120_01001 [Neisseria sp. oral taxon 020 str. F0370]
MLRLVVLLMLSAACCLVSFLFWLTIKGRLKPVAGFQMAFFIH